MMNEIKLNLGCGDKKISGFINVDIRESVQPDIVDDIILNKIENCSVDLIYASHVLEHTKRSEILKVLSRWYEILKPGGIVRLAVPDFESVVKMYLKGTPINNLIGFLYGGQNHDYNFHYYCWDFNSLKKDLEEVGFIHVCRFDWRITEHGHIDDYSQSYLPHMDKENGQLMSLNVEGTK